MRDRGYCSITEKFLDNVGWYVLVLLRFLPFSFVAKKDSDTFIPGASLGYKLSRFPFVVLSSAINALKI